MSTFLYEHNAPILSPFVYKQLKIGLLEKDLGTQCFCLPARLTLAHVGVGWITAHSPPFQDHSNVIPGREKNLLRAHPAWKPSGVASEPRAT